MSMLLCEKCTGWKPDMKTWVLAGPYESCDVCGGPPFEVARETQTGRKTVYHLLYMWEGLDGS